VDSRDRVRLLPRVAPELRYLGRSDAPIRGAPRQQWDAKDNDAMIGRWSQWKPFPNACHGEHIEAPIGPGVYEVCHAPTQEVVAFGCTANVAQALSKVLPSGGGRRWPFFRRATAPHYETRELEYRTCATGSLEEARFAAAQLMGHRQAMWRRLAPIARA
jgi:hypothetical protein